MTRKLVHYWKSTITKEGDVESVDIKKGITTRVGHIITRES